MIEFDEKWVRAMAEALAFYAKADVYRVRMDKDPVYHDGHPTYSEIERDKGERARSALAWGFTPEELSEIAVENTTVRILGTDEAQEYLRDHPKFKARILRRIEELAKLYPARP